MSLCEFDGSPPLNNDIAGIGVRISLYAQALLTIITAAVLPPEDIFAQMSTYAVLNISVLSAALILGSSENPQITLQDCLVILFVNAISTIITQFASKLVHVKLRSKGNQGDVSHTLPVLLLIRDILGVVFTSKLLRHHETFGSNPECNSAAKVFIFRVFAASHSYFVFLVAYYVIALVLVSCIDSQGIVRTQAWRIWGRNEDPQVVNELPQPVDEDSKLLTPVQIVYNTILHGALAVTCIIFTELTVAANNFAPSTGPIWQFGQIFPLFLLAVPLLETMKAFFRRVQGQRKKNQRPQAPNTGPRDEEENFDLGAGGSKPPINQSLTK